MKRGRRGSGGSADQADLELVGVTRALHQEERR
jgi:hypothetical protein